MASALVLRMLVLVRVFEKAFRLLSVPRGWGDTKLVGDQVCHVGIYVR